MDISFQTARINNKSFDVPLFMDQSQNDAIAEIIENFERSIGLKEAEFDSGFIFEIFSDSKIAKGLYFVLTKYFYDIKGLEDSDLQSFSVRIKLYELMEQSDLSWATIRQQKQLLGILSESEGSSDIELQEKIFSDYSENFKVIRRGTEKPKIELVIKYYNTEILKFLFAKSYIISFILHDYIPKGNFVKLLIRNCKFLGLETDLDVIKENETFDLQVNILGPNELVGRNIKYANNIYALFIENLDIFRNEISELFLEMQYFESQKKIYLPLVDFPTFIDDSKSEEVFDSEIEKTFFDQWIMNFPHWTITREPLIVEQNIVMIPDFMLQYRNVNFYFEIVGFWTERYLSKKVKKVSILKNKYPNMILLVDKALDWPETTGVATYYYGKKIPVLEIGKYLKEFENKEVDSLIEKAPINKLKLIIDTKLKEKNLLYEENLHEILSTSFSFEVLRFIENFFATFKNQCDFIYFTKYTFISSTEFLFELKKFLYGSKINTNLSFKRLKKQFSFIEEKYLKLLVIYLGFDFKYKSLLEEELVFKKDKVIKSEIV